MMNSKNLKKQQGFTLVEVIVVAIIVAAYVTSSRNNAAANAAGSVASFMGACINQGGSAADSVGSAELADGDELTGPATLTCLKDTSKVAAITIPKDVIITISKAKESPGTVTGRGGAATEFSDQVYSY
jgi:prepilin-type N-terminal cleavage/methylation domain-containing protein